MAPQVAWILLLCPRCLNQVWVRPGSTASCSRGGRHPRTEMVEPPPEKKPA